jgi:hypothetical protein
VPHCTLWPDCFNCRPQLCKGAADGVRSELAARPSNRSRRPGRPAPDSGAQPFIQLEELGICERGEAFKFVRERDITWRGDFPINTGGGQLSAGQAGASGGMIGVVEAVLQLRGEAGRRQLACRCGLVSGYGMVAYGRGLSTSAAILERVDP